MSNADKKNQPGVTRLPITEEALTRQAKTLITTPPSRLEVDTSDAEQFLLAMIRTLCTSLGHDPRLTPNYLAAVKLTAQTLTQTPKSLIILGGIGNGKTTLAQAVAALFRHCTNVGVCSGACRYVHAEDVAMLANNDADLFQDMLTAPRLIIDDIGTEPSEGNNYGTRTTPVATVLRKRYESRRLTVLTTNLTPEQLQAKYGKRVMDRLREWAVRVILSDKSYR